MDNTKDPNYLFRAKLDGESKLRILLSGKSKPKVSVRRLSKVRDEAVLPVEDPVQPLLKKKGGLLLNFYDLGTFNWGTPESPIWEDLDWAYGPTIDPDDITSGGTVLTDETTWASLKSAIFAVDLEDFDSYYKKLSYEEAEKYGIDVYLGTMAGASQDTSKQYGVGRANSRILARHWEDPVTGEGWTASGFASKTIPASLGIVSESAFIGFGRIDTTIWGQSGTNYKITDVDDPDASDVGFQWKGKIDVFLVPLPIVVEGRNTDVSEAMHRHHFGLFYTIQSRYSWLDLQDPYDYWETQTGYPAMGPLSHSWKYNTLSPAFNNANVRDTSYGFRFYLDALYYKSTDAGSTYVAQTKTTFPQETNTGDRTTMGFFTKAQTQGGLDMKVSVYPATLLAMLRKGGQWYYVWANETRDLDLRGFSHEWIY